MKKVLLAAFLGMFVVSSAFARAAAWGNNDGNKTPAYETPSVEEPVVVPSVPMIPLTPATPIEQPDIVEPTPDVPVVEPDIPEVPDDDIVTVHPVMPSVNPSYIAQNKAKAAHHHHKSWWDKHGNEVIVGTVVTAAFVGVAVYAFGMEQSQNDPTKVTIMKF